MKTLLIIGLSAIVILQLILIVALIKERVDVIRAKNRVDFRPTSTETFK